MNKLKNLNIIKQDVFKIQVPNIGPAKAVYYDIAALKEVYKYVTENNIDDAIIYILACRIGPFFKEIC